MQEHDEERLPGRDFACVTGKKPSGQHSPARPLPPHRACLTGSGCTDLHWGPGPGQAHPLTAASAPQALVWI